MQNSKLIIIGNGFDLNLGLKTSYLDFIRSDYFKSIEKSNKIAAIISQSKDESNWIDIEVKLKAIAKIKEIADFEIEFNEICTQLLEYLRTIDYTPIYSKSVAFDLIDDLYGCKFKILDFNYTRSTQLLLNNSALAPSMFKSCLIKMHGSVDENNIIFGVEDKADILINHIYLKKSVNKSFKPISIKKEAMSYDEVHIFGHSLGETDRMYFESFFRECVLENSVLSGKKICIYYHGAKSYNDLFIQLDYLTGNNITGLRQNNSLELINTMK